MSKKTPAEEAAELRQVVIEAHGAIKDLTRLIREAKATIVAVEVAAHDAVEKDLGEAIKDGLDSLTKAISHAIEKAETAVDHRFQTVADILLGEDGAAARRGDPSLTDYAHQVADLRKGGS